MTLPLAPTLSLNSNNLLMQLLNLSYFSIFGRYRQSLLRDQKYTPLETAIYWTEYVIRHNGAYHLQTPGRDLG